jgi:hypothetical protein
VLHLLEQHLLLAQQLVLFAFRISPLGYVLDRQEQGRVGMGFVEDLAALSSMIRRPKVGKSCSTS